MLVLHLARLSYFFFHVNTNHMKHAIHAIYKSSAELFMPIRRESAFIQQGILTPDEFVVAGNHLTQSCPTWKWGTCLDKFLVSHLPKDKQFVTTKNVPCLQRASMTEFPAADLDDYQIIQQNDSHDDNSIPDLVDLQGMDDDDILCSLRTYDIMITYDKFYGVPRCWLFGYDSEKQPLPPKFILEDMSSDHAKKTITIDPFPFSGILCASIHPCRHAGVLHRLVTMAKTHGHAIKVDDALIVFLKFLSSVCPSIQYDFTTASGF